VNQRKATSSTNIYPLTLFDSPLCDRRVGPVPIYTVPRTAPQRICYVIRWRRAPKVGVSIATLVEVTRPLESGMIFRRPWNDRKEKSVQITKTDIKSLLNVSQVYYRSWTFYERNYQSVRPWNIKCTQDTMLQCNQLYNSEDKNIACMSNRLLQKAR
jgi:hypothetical protein